MAVLNGQRQAKVMEDALSSAEEQSLLLQLETKEKCVALLDVLSARGRWQGIRANTCPSASSLMG